MLGDNFSEVIKSTLTYNIPLGVLVLILFFVLVLYQSGRRLDNKVLSDYARERKEILKQQRQMYREIIQDIELSKRNKNKKN